jgi:hypothetical protein
MSRLEIISKPFRDSAVVKNDYDKNDEYVQSHQDALSTGDELGKGENNGDVGGITDIKTRKSLMVKNKYKCGYVYDASTA